MQITNRKTHLNHYGCKCNHDIQIAWYLQYIHIFSLCHVHDNEENIFWNVVARKSVDMLDKHVDGVD